MVTDTTPAGGSRVVRGPVTVLALVAVGWCLLVGLAPTAVHTHAAGGEGGAWAAFVYQAAGRVCHQQVARSMAWAGVPFPVCGRCLALYLSGAAGLVAAAWAAWRAPALLLANGRALWRWPVGRAATTWTAAAALPSALLLVVEWTVADPGTVARAVASVPLGLVLGWISGRALGQTTS